MAWLVLIGELILGFIVGTVVLWACSFTVKTDNANFKTAAIYNAIMTAIGGYSWQSHSYSCTPNRVLREDAFRVTILTLIVSFWLLMRMYNISFSQQSGLSSLWATDTLVKKP